MRNIAKKIDLAPKIAVISIFCRLQPIKSLMLRFGITKLSLITNIENLKTFDPVV